MLRRSERRQIRKDLGRKRGQEWRIFGHITRRWAYFRRDTLTGSLLPTSRQGGWQARVPVQAVPDPARDALNESIFRNVQTIGHIAQGAK
jgi:hypothetical protein